MNNISYSQIMSLDTTHPNQIVMVVFGHQNCGYCPYAKQIVSKIGIEEGLQTFYCDTMQNPQTVQWFAITSVPFSIIVKNGEVVQIIKGSKTEADYKEFLRKVK